MDKKEKILVVALFITIIVLLVAMGVTIKSFDKYMEASDKLENTLSKEVEELKNERLTNNDRNENKTKEPESGSLELELGEYELDLSTVQTPEGFTEEEKENYYTGINMKFSEENVATVYLGEGTRGIGKYTLSGDEVEISFTDWESESGGYFEITTEPVIIKLERENENALVVKERTETVKIIEIKENRGNLEEKEINLSQYGTVEKGARYIKK